MQNQNSYSKCLGFLFLLKNSMSIVFAEKTRGIGRIRKSRLPHQAQHCMELTLNWAPGDTDTERWKMSSGSGRKASCPPWALGVWDGLTTECNGKDSLMEKKTCSVLLVPLNSLVFPLP